VAIQFGTDDEDRGIEVRDTSEGEQFTLRADREVSPEPASTDEFAMPVDAAVAVDAGALHFPLYRPAVVIEDGDVVDRIEDEASSGWLPRGTYEVDASPPGAKTYVKVCDAGVRARFTDDHTHLDVEPATRLVVGVRSHHERPAGTVTTTEDPRDVMRAVSAFGSALKTHSPDRSWPTLRGHPPALELGATLDIPDAVEQPATGVTVEVPPEYGSIFTVAPLAYYLGATVEPGAEPRLRAAGTSREFDPDALASEVAALLEHCFVLDGVVRTVGVYPFRHEQADRLEERVDLDYERLFDLPLDERTAAYLDVPRSATEGLVGWHLTADVAPAPRCAAALPHLVDELAAVRSPPPDPRPAEHSPEPDALARARGRASTTAPADALVPDPVDTPGHVWVGEGFAVAAANPTVGSFRRGSAWPSGEAPLDVHVVYNDERLAAPDELAYGNHRTAETDVRVSHSLTTTELRAALLADTDFLHFVGHVTERGMVCPDGELDVRTLPTTGVGAFFLNGCRSYEQGFALLTAGAAGGIVTVDDVEDEVAGEAGYRAAMLLDTGLPLYGVLDVLERAGTDTSRYAVLGDPTLQLRRTTTGGALVAAFDTDSGAWNDDRLPVTAHAYPAAENGQGSHFTPAHFDSDSQLFSATDLHTRIPRGELAHHLEEDPLPTLLDGDLVRNTDLSLEDLDGA